MAIGQKRIFIQYIFIKYQYAWKIKLKKLEIKLIFFVPYFLADNTKNGRYLFSIGSFRQYISIIFGLASSLFGHWENVQVRQIWGTQP